MDFTTDISVQYLKEQLFLQWYKFLQFLNNVVKYPGTIFSHLKKSSIFMDIFSVELSKE